MPTDPPLAVHPHHRVLLESFGGITESFGDPGSWIANHGAVLTRSLADKDATFIEAYDWAFRVTGGIPLDLRAYYAVAEEANGNTTLCHRIDGNVVLSAPDHAFDHVAVLEGCPENSFYRLKGAPTIADWVNTIADQWRPRG